MTSLNLNEYKTIGEALKRSKRDLKLISKLISTKEIEFTSDNFDDPLDVVIDKLLCDLENFSRELESEMDIIYESEVVSTIDYFN